ncbi:MAG TPA: LTA synthase family protein, partial [Leptospiraceae bacterium]|nr:LTA synthase family protein [Leptospiraceae bacterium]
PIILSIWVAFHLIGDIVYFANSNKHLGYEGFIFLNKDIILLIKSFLLEKPFIFFVSIAISIFYLTSSFFLWVRHFHFVETSRKIMNRLAELILILVLSVFLIRGGIQTTSLRPSHSIISDNNFINTLCLNGIFTSFSDMIQTQIPNSKKIPIEEAILHVRESIEYEGAEFVNPAYPILRKSLKANSDKPPSIVLILLESWTGKFVKPISKDGLIDGKEVTPNFNKLIQEGVFFKRFFATGGRTSNGLFASLTGLPDRPMISVLHTQEANARVSGLGKILKQIDYQNLFMTGSSLAFENISPHIQRWGFDRIIDERNIESTNKFKKGVWGYDDADGLSLFNEYLRELNPDKPFLGIYLTISTHYPYKVPDPKFEIFDSKTMDFDFLNTYHYADYAIGKFIEEAKKEKYFSNTIFIFVADHTHHRFLNHYEDRNIPFLIYAPNRFKPEIRNTISSQLDIIPTIVGLTGKPLLFSAMGKDLFASNIKSFAYFCFGYLYGWIDEEHFYFQNIGISTKTLNFPMTEPYIDRNNCDILPECKLTERKTNAFLNLPIQLLERNLIFPY